jgi:hypothetical protein
MPNYFDISEVDAEVKHTKGEVDRQKDTRFLFLSSRLGDYFFVVSSGSIWK